MKSGFTLLREIAIPLLILVIVLLCLHTYFNKAEGFFINLATELIGIMFTIFYVDYILKKREEERWKKTQRLVEREVHLLCIDYITILHDFYSSSITLEQGVQALFQNLQTNNFGNIANDDDFIAHAQFYKSHLKGVVLNLDEEKWMNLLDLAQSQYDKIEKILLKFNSRFPPELFSNLLRFQDELHKITFIASKKFALEIKKQKAGSAIAEATHFVIEVLKMTKHHIGD